MSLSIQPHRPEGPPMTRIAIIGRGSVGTALEQGLTTAGHEVQTVGKEPDRVREAGRWGRVVVLAVPYQERQNAVKELGDSVRGKTLIDVTNALGTNMEFIG